MLTINKKIYVPLGRISSYVEEADSERIWELVKERKIKSFKVNGHIMVCLEDVKKEAKQWILTK